MTRDTRPTTAADTTGYAAAMRPTDWPMVTADVMMAAVTAAVMVMLLLTAVVVALLAPMPAMTAVHAVKCVSPLTLAATVAVATATAPVLAPTLVPVMTGERPGSSSCLIPLR